MKSFRRYFSLALVVQGAFGVIISGLLLSACGGGTGGTGGGHAVGTYIPKGTVSGGGTGAVSASFVAGTVGSAFFLLPASGTQVTPGAFIAPASLVQAPSGAMVQLGKYTLTGSTSTMDIAGDANFAQGRWVAGVVTDISASSVLDTMNGSVPYDAWHYVLINALAAVAVPTSGTKSCDSGTFTTPTYVGGTYTTNTAVTTSNAPTLSFSATGASINFTLTTRAGALSANTPISATGLTSNIYVFTGSMAVGGSGAYVLLSDGGAGTYRISGIYMNTVAGGATYQGAYTFHCI